MADVLALVARIRYIKNNKLTVHTQTAYTVMMKRSKKYPLGTAFSAGIVFLRWVISSGRAFNPFDRCRENCKQARPRVGTKKWHGLLIVTDRLQHEGV
ncbi:MAG: hypothetical protein WDN30_11355 [Pararobbsia sp.]